jgi:SAM-dependent methyltransferase
MNTRKQRMHQQTIIDFGEQWTRYPHNDGYYGSQALLEDILGPLLQTEELRGQRVVDIGSGTGRIVNMVLVAGARHVTAVEPSDAFDVLLRNVAWAGERVTCLQFTGDRLPPDGQYDCALSVGVLHHIPDPDPVVTAVFNALRPGGRFLAWLYAREGNAAYLVLARPLRLMTKHLPHSLLAALVRMLDLPLAAYIQLCRRVRLPLHDYMTAVLGRLAPDQRRLVVYDQLNPTYAKYYTAGEALDLLANAGFRDVRLHHRRGYSWTVVGTKP